MARDDDDFYEDFDASDFDVERFEEDDNDWAEHDWPDDWDYLGEAEGWEVWDIDVDIDYGPE